MLAECPIEMWGEMKKLPTWLRGREFLSLLLMAGRRLVDIVEITHVKK